VREFGDNQYRVFDNGRDGRKHHRLAGGHNYQLDIAHGDDQRLADSCGRLDLYGNHFRGLRRGDGYGLYHGNGQ
jgi:hypothetical protein